MNEYRFEDLSVGMEETFLVKITEEMYDRFLAISGDDNPLHTDEDFAKSFGFSSRVAYGMMIASFFSTLGGVYLPGRYCIIQGVSMDFRAPVYAGDELTVTGSVAELFPSVSSAQIKVVMKNSDGKKVVRGRLKVGFLK